MALPLHARVVVVVAVLAVCVRVVSSRFVRARACWKDDREGEERLALYAGC